MDFAGAICRHARGAIGRLITLLAPRRHLAHELAVIRGDHLHRDPLPPGRGPHRLNGQVSQAHPASTWAQSVSPKPPAFRRDLRPRARGRLGPSTPAAILSPRGRASRRPGQAPNTRACAHVGTTAQPDRPLRWPTGTAVSPTAQRPRAILRPRGHNLPTGSAPPPAHRAAARLTERARRPRAILRHVGATGLRRDPQPTWPRPIPPNRQATARDPAPTWAPLAFPPRSPAHVATGSARQPGPPPRPQPGKRDV